MIQDGITMRTDKAVQEEMMATKSPQAQPKGNVKLEARVPGGMKLNPGQPVQVRPL